jgi:hypothetical protein
MQGDLLVKLGTKFFHIAGVPWRQADNPYFVSAVRETQKWGEFSLIVMTRKFSFALRFCICSHDFYMVAGEGIVSPTGRHIYVSGTALGVPLNNWEIPT